MKLILNKIPFQLLIPILYSIAVVLMVIYQWNEQISVRQGSGSPFYRNLMESPAFVRKGFDPADILKIPDVSTIKTDNSPWVRFESPPIVVTNSNLPDLPARAYLWPFGKPAEEFTILFHVEMDNAAIALMNNDPTAVPGVYFSIIAENWEIYLNGNLVRSELHLDETGQITSRRTWRDVYFILGRDLFTLGTNVLALRIVGDPTYNATGLYYTQPHYIDDYRFIQKNNQHYLLYFICGVLAYTGIYYLLIFIFVRNKKELFNLYYGVFSIMLCLHYATTTGTINFIIPDSDIASGLEYFSIFLAISMLCIFIEESGRRRVSKISWGFLGLSLFFGITQIFFSSQYADEIMHIYLISMLLYFTFVFFSIILYYFRELRKKRHTDIFFSILVGSVIVYACGIHDALDIVIFRNHFRLFLFSTFVFHVGIAITLSNRFSRMYNRLEQSNVLLEKTVYERTVELEEQTMIAVQASAAKSQFLATMSHEIRTPLNAIIGLSEIELQSSLPQKSKNNIKQINQSGSTLLAIINDILDISKIEAGGLELIPVEYDTASLINDTININKVRIASKPINLVLEINGDFPGKLYGDELRVKQILNNFLSNAIKYTKEGSVTLTIQWEPSKQNKALIRFIIRDTGIGIRKHEIEKLFTDYAQLDTKANRMIEGTGLGLVITKKLVDVMEGKILAESEYGKGSVFTVELFQGLIYDLNQTFAPIGEETADSLRRFKYVNEHKGSILVRSWMPYRKVLVVDDLLSNLFVAKGLLEPYGLQVETAVSGQEAIDMVASGKNYDLIFMDHMMPGMDGIETVAHIRTWEKEQHEEYPEKLRKQIPIIALTANALVGSRENFISNGFNGFISKPIDTLQLDEVLNQWIQDRQRFEVSDASMKNQTLANEKNFYLPGVIVKHGIESTGGSMSGYIAALSIFCKDALVRLPLIENQLNNILSEQDMSAFSEHVQALESPLETLGAKQLSAKARALEAAGNTRDYIFINKNLPFFIKYLTELVENIQAVISEQGVAHGNQFSRITAK